MVRTTMQPLKIRIKNISNVAIATFIVFGSVIFFDVFTRIFFMKSHSLSALQLSRLSISLEVLLCLYVRAFSHRFIIHSALHVRTQLLDSQISNIKTVIVEYIPIFQVSHWEINIFNLFFLYVLFKRCLFFSIRQNLNFI